ncbi:hypothetical protein [Oleisolibacter albus]|uniref:hypothetical protein n=1 Tax=Oleisolibacter albus TaxID=2171757 RepID=UPI0012D71E2F|nr:hypothetical protein [Oleisolibacter albus]
MNKTTAPDERRPASAHATRPPDHEGTSPGGNVLPGDQRQEMERTPGDGSLTGATPAGLTAEELRRRAEQPGPVNDAGTG